MTTVFGIPLWFAVVVLALGIVWAVLTISWRSHGVRQRHDEWKPALSAEAEKEGVHVVTSDYPRGSRWEREAMAHSWTVPKDPQAYAKIFVPKDDSKGDAR